MSGKISADSDAGALAGNEVIPLLKSGLNKTTTPDTLATRIAAALGLSSAATHVTGYFATAAQGAKADTAGTARRCRRHQRHDRRVGVERHDLYRH